MNEMTLMNWFDAIFRSSGLLATIKLCTLVTPITLALFGGHSRLPPDSVKEAPVRKSRGHYDYGSDSDEYLNGSSYSDGN